MKKLCAVLVLLVLLVAAVAFAEGDAALNLTQVHDYEVADFALLRGRHAVHARNVWRVCVSGMVTFDGLLICRILICTANNQAAPGG